MCHVVYVSDAKYRPYVEVSAASVRASASLDIEVHIIDVDAPEVAARLAEFPEYHGSRATFAKLLIPELLPNVDWALYLDGDTLALGDICEVFQCCDETKLILGSRDPENFNLGPDVETPWLRLKGLQTPRPYFCAGVMLMNLRAMREEKVLEQVLDFFKRHGVPPLNEQTALNCICQGKTGLLPAQWGVFSMCPEDVDFTKSAIVHYPQDLPWKRKKLNKLTHDLVWIWWKFVEKAEAGCGTGEVRVFDATDEDVRCPGAWRRWIWLAIMWRSWLVAWSPYLKARLRPLHGLTSEEQSTILSRWRERRK